MSSSDRCSTPPPGSLHRQGSQLSEMAQAAANLQSTDYKACSPQFVLFIVVLRRMNRNELYCSLKDWGTVGFFYGDTTVRGSSYQFRCPNRIGCSLYSVLGSDQDALVA
jgi:hypothetical protein